MLSNDQIQRNWDKFLDLIEEYADSSSRWKILYDFYRENEQRFAFMPASGKLAFHSAFTGGHISHTLRVYETALELSLLWEKMGAINDFTAEELAFVALNHDIGKFGTADAETFIDQDSDWHRKQGEVYKHNPALAFMKDYDRSLYLLQELGVKMSEAEYLAIKLQSGLYEESNKSYFMAYKDEFKLKSNLPYILHQADAMSARIESTTGPKPTPPVDKKPYQKYPAKAPKASTSKFDDVPSAPKTKSKFTKYLE